MSRAARQALALRAAPPRDLHLERRADLLWIETQYLIPDPHQPVSYTHLPYDCHY